MNIVIKAMQEGSLSSKYRNFHSSLKESYRYCETMYWATIDHCVINYEFICLCIQHSSLQNILKLQHTATCIMYICLLYKEIDLYILSKNSWRYCFEDSNRVFWILTQAIMNNFRMKFLWWWILSMVVWLIDLELLEITGCDHIFACTFWPCCSCWTTKNVFLIKSLWSIRKRISIAI